MYSCISLLLSSCPVQVQTCLWQSITVNLRVAKLLEPLSGRMFRDKYSTDQDHHTPLGTESRADPLYRTFPFPRGYIHTVGSILKPVQ
uniref:Putative secreted protein n=1 Tax=Ixodes ricinus TaxID=34613 RepID=A0A6B0U269_IXORI